jgi:hypothetical protein
MDDPDPGSLEGDVYTPGGDPRLTGAQDATDAAGRRIQSGDPYSTRVAGNADRYRSVLGTGQVAGRRVNTDVSSRAIDPRVAGGPDVNADESGRYLAEQDAAVAGLGGPSRTNLAKQALADFDTAGEAGLAKRFRKVGQTAAKFGQMGLGSVNAELGSIEGDYERDRMAKSNELAQSVAEGDISDRFRRVDATSGLRRGESGIESGLRGEQRTERDYDTSLDERNIGRDFAERDFQTEIEEGNLGRQRGERDAELGLDERNQDRAFDRERAAQDFGARDAGNDINNEYDKAAEAGRLEDRIAGQGRQNRDEFRTERGYQGSRRQQTLDNRVRQRELENAERDQEFQRAQDRLYPTRRGTYAGS